MKIITPYHYKLYQCDRGRWFTWQEKPFYNSSGHNLELDQVEKQFGLTQEKVAIELFRINGGNSGYYLANLRDRQYYYCGTEWEDVKTTLRSLGIGRDDPMETNNAAS